MRLCETCSNAVDGKKRFCANCQKEKHRNKQSLYRELNRGKVLEAKKIYRQKNPEKVKKGVLKAQAQSRHKAESELRDYIVVERLGLTKITATKQLIEAKRQQLLFRRALIELNKTIKELKHGN